MFWRSTLSFVLCFVLASRAAMPQDVAGTAAAPKYKLTIVEDASTSKRAKKGRVSSQAVVKVTDENNLPVPLIAIAFVIPQSAGGAAFATGGLTSMVVTNAAGIATSGTFTAPAGASFSMSATASLPGGGVLTASVPVTASVGAAGAAAGGAAGAGAGLSTGVIVGIVVAVAVAAAVGIAVGLNKGGSSSPAATPPSTVPTGTIGSPGTPTIGAP